jgi:hypothetical protein
VLWSPGAAAQNLLHIRILEGEGAIHGAGAKASRPIVIEITDETGKPVEGAAVSFRMPEEGPGATFQQGMRTDIRITTPDGKAAVYDFTTNRTPGPFQVRITAVKSQVRAGVVVAQYISDRPVKAKSDVAKGGSRKWLIVLAAAGGAAAAALAAGAAKGSTPGSAGPAAPPPTPPQIGPPSIHVTGTP